MNNLTHRLSILGLVLVVGCATTPEVKMASDSRWQLHGTPLDRSAARFDNDYHEHLAWAATYRRQIVDADGSRTIENTLGPYNEMMMHLDAAKSEGELFASVHPDAGVRKVAEKGEQAAIKFITELRLDRELYEAFVALDVSRANGATRFLVSKILRDFRRAGVDRDAALRERMAALSEEIVAIGQEFSKNIREDDREILLDSLADLDGLPGDWVAKHQPGPDGKIHVTTQYPDYYPIMTYARSPDVRRALYTEFKNRGYPKNIEVLDRLMTKRHELATMLGYANWAAYATEDKMIETADNAQAFIDRISQAAKPAAERDYQALLARKRQDVPGATAVEDWEKEYYETLVKNETYAFDPQSVRPYFSVTDTLDGLFKLTGKLFGINYRQVHGLNLWHPDVTAWDVYDGSRKLGRFYLDLYPRKDKYGHAAQFDYRTGIAGKRLPQAVLVCNFPNPRDNKNGVALMEHSEVETLFHEFGHLLHVILSGHRQWMGNAGIATEWDFVEAPSQMLEEWTFDAPSLQIFARHHETGRPIPAELVEKLRRASEFGKGIQAAHQLFYTAVSLSYYNRDPKGLDSTKLMTEMQAKYSPFPHVDGTHFQCSFGHLDQYSAYYYTYLWSLVIAKDMFSKFERDGILNTRTARKYRHLVLEPGGSKKAADLIADFLGRRYSFDAFERWMERM